MLKLRPNSAVKIRLFVAAIESFEYQSTFHKGPKDEGCGQWTWLFERHSQCHALALVLLELNERPVGDKDGLFERGWNAVTSYTFPDSPRGNNTRPYKEQRPLFEPIAKLREKVRRKINAALDCNGANIMASGNELMEDQPIDWVCVFSPLGSQSLDCVSVVRKEGLFLDNG